MTKSEQSGRSAKNGLSKLQEKPIRVLQFIGSLNLGGSQSMIMNLYRSIDREKIQFDFVIDRKNETFFKKEIESYGGRVFVFDEYFKGINYYRYCRQWEEFFKGHPEYRIVHCHVRSVASIVLKIAKRNGLKTICHSHSISNGKGVKSVVKKYLQRGIVEYSDSLLACSEDAAIWLFGKNAAQSKKCDIIHNAIDPERYRFDKEVRFVIRQQLGVADDAVLVGHIGRFVDVKNHKFMVKLAEDLDDSKIQFVFCGEGKMKKEIINESKGKRISFYNDYKKANELYNAMDLFVLPSKYEGLGMVLLEAQFNGLPCLASIAVPKSTMISDSIEYLPLDSEVWCKKISTFSPRRKSGQKLLSQADNYKIEHEVAKVEQLYNELYGANYDNGEE